MILDSTATWGESFLTCSSSLGLWMSERISCLIERSAASAEIRSASGNWEAQFNSAMPFTIKIFGNESAAREFSKRVVERFSDPEVYVYCALFYVEGRVPRYASQV